MFYQNKLFIEHFFPNFNKRKSNEFEFLLFFSLIFSSRFSTLSLLSFNEIHSELFLSTCEQYLHLIDKLNSTTFIPYRSDINENINVNFFIY